MRKIIRFLGLQINGLFPWLYPFIDQVSKPIFLLGPLYFFLDFFKYSKLAHGKNVFMPKILDFYPIYFDRFAEAGIVPKHYFFQDIWASRIIFELGVKKHYDVGSRLDGFISHCLSFCEVTMLDVRPLPITVSGLTFLQTDCTKMTKLKSGSLSSISSLHAIEHFGLGRYGAPIDPDGYRKAISEIQRVVKSNGDIIFACPIGRERLEFNAHRVFNPKSIMTLFKQCKLIEFSAVDDNNRFINNADIKAFDKAEFSCGLFHFKKT